VIAIVTSAAVHPATWTSLTVLGHDEDVQINCCPEQFGTVPKLAGSCQSDLDLRENDELLHPALLNLEDEDRVDDLTCAKGSAE
jgi:hypothetical protein